MVPIDTTGADAVIFEPEPEDPTLTMANQVLLVSWLTLAPSAAQNSQQDATSGRVPRSTASGSQLFRPRHAARRL